MDATTGGALGAFQPKLNGSVEALEAGPPGSNTVYVGGTFTSVNGSLQNGLAVLDATTWRAAHRRQPAVTPERRRARQRLGPASRRHEALRGRQLHDRRQLRRGRLQPGPGRPLRHRHDERRLLEGVRPGRQGAGHRRRPDPPEHRLPRRPVQRREQLAVRWPMRFEVRVPGRLRRRPRAPCSRNWFPTPPNRRSLPPRRFATSRRGPASCTTRRAVAVAGSSSSTATPPRPSSTRSSPRTATSRRWGSPPIAPALFVGGHFTKIVNPGHRPPCQMFSVSDGTALRPSRPSRTSPTAVTTVPSPSSPTTPLDTWWGGQLTTLASGYLPPTTRPTPRAGDLWHRRPEEQGRRPALGRRASPTSVTTRTSCDPTPPAAPTERRPSPGVFNGMNLSWTGVNDPTVTAYYVRATGPGLSIADQVVATQFANTTSASISPAKLQPNSVYQFKVCAVDLGDNERCSAPVAGDDRRRSAQAAQPAAGLRAVHAPPGARADLRHPHRPRPAGHRPRSPAACRSRCRSPARRPALSAPRAPW